MHTPPAITFATGADWVAAHAAAHRLLETGHRVLWVTAPAPAGSVTAGDFVVPLSPAFDPGLAAAVPTAPVTRVLDQAGLPWRAVEADDSLTACPIAPVRVGLYGGGGAPFNHASIFAACGFAIRFLSDAEVRAGALATVDVFVMPGGGARAMAGQLDPLGEAGCRAIDQFVRDGGMYIGCCAGTYDCIVNTEAVTAFCPFQSSMQLLNARALPGESPLADFGGINSPGIGVLTVTNVRPEHPVLFGMPDSFPLVHYNGPILDPLPAGTIAGASGTTGLLTIAGTTERFTPAEAFAAATPDDRTYVEQGIAAGGFAAVAGELGAGRVVGFGSHPELGADLPMVEWFATARLLVNAVLWQATRGSGTAGARPLPAPLGQVTLPIGASYAAVHDAAAALMASARRLQAQSIDPQPGWLAPEYALAAFGLDRAAIWQQSLAAIVGLAERARDDAAAIAARVRTLTAAGPAPAPVREALLRAEAFLHDRRDPAWDQDGGYQGVLALLTTATAMCDQALANWEIELGPPAGAYGYLTESPYHLAAGSYLAAVGVTGGAVQLLRVIAAQLDQAAAIAADRAAGEPANARTLITA